VRTPKPPLSPCKERRDKDWPPSSNGLRQKATSGHQRPLSIKQHSWGVFLDLRPSKGLGFRLAVALPQDLKIPFLRATGLEHSCYLELAFWSPVFHEIGRNATDGEINRIQGD
jgi:hypothetical protein